jgi:hypothetical protein
MARKRRTTLVRLREPKTVPMTRRTTTAVSTPSVVILDWWRFQAGDQEPKHVADDPVVEG